MLIDAFFSHFTKIVEMVYISDMNQQVFMQRISFLKNEGIISMLPGYTIKKKVAFNESCNAESKHIN